jgi:LysR family hydrogen peroxide-inducible transcriptional activator
MTLTELKYIVAVARERHFGRAAESCFVSQPTLSVAIRKLEDELGVTLFERGNSEIGVTPVGQQIVEQAQKVLAQTAGIREIARQGKDPLSGPLRLGVIYTIGPYLLPPLMRQMIDHVPQMPLLLHEDFTAKLIEALKQGELDAAIMALPLPDIGLMAQPLYDESFVVAVPRGHPWERRKAIPAEDLKSQTMLLLGAGHCFRDQVLEVCPELARYAPAGTDGSHGAGAHGSMQRTFEGSSLETIRHMVASGIGVTLLPRTSVPLHPPANSLLRYIPLQEPVQHRRVVLVWRKTFPRHGAIEALRRAVLACALEGAMLLDLPATQI